MSDPKATPTAVDRQAIVEVIRQALATGELRDIVVEAATEALNSEELTLDVAAAAKALGCGKRFLLDGCNKYGFPYIDMGKFKRFGPRELQEIRDMRRVSAQPSKLAQARRAKAKARSQKTSSEKSAPTRPGDVEFQPAA